jgi:nucleoid-associated protein YgaU
MISSTSRYQAIDTATYTSPDGREHRYLRRRFLPQAGTAIVMAQHIVSGSDRLDNIAAQRLGDPEQYWRICDANNALRAEDVMQVNRTLVIPLPQKG